MVHNMESSFLIAQSHRRLLHHHTSRQEEYSFFGLGLILLDGHPFLYTFKPFTSVTSLVARSFSTNGGCRFDVPYIRTTGFFPACFPEMLDWHGDGNGYLFDYESILDGFDPADAACDLARLVLRFLRINEAAQLNDAFAGFDTDLK
jgi:hypothetical protein